MGASKVIGRWMPRSAALSDTPHKDPATTLEAGLARVRGEVKVWIEFEFMAALAMTAPLVSSSCSCPPSMRDWPESCVENAVKTLKFSENQNWLLLTNTIVVRDAGDGEVGKQVNLDPVAVRIGGVIDPRVRTHGGVPIHGQGARGICIELGA